MSLVAEKGGKFRDQTLNSSLLAASKDLTRVMNRLKAIYRSWAISCAGQQNILSNALKYRSEKVPCIQVSAQIQGKNAVFSITDNGIGISHEYHKTIFVSFQRLHGKEYSGTGLGLASCQRIVERHGGRLWVEVESQPGQGSIFVVKIPIAGTA